jgi:carbon-monoxide dehydrogenase large subunit
VVDYEPQPAVVDAREALKAGSPQLWPEAPGNLAFDWTAPADPDGKKQAVLERAFGDEAELRRIAAHTVDLVLGKQRR